MLPNPFALPSSACPSQSLSEQATRKDLSLQPTKEVHIYIIQLTCGLLALRYATPESGGLCRQSRGAGGAVGEAGALHHLCRLPVSIPAALCTTKDPSHQSCSNTGPFYGAKFAATYPPKAHLEAGVAACPV